MVNGRAWSAEETALVLQQIRGPARQLGERLNRTTDAILIRAQKRETTGRSGNDSAPLPD